MAEKLKGAGQSAYKGKYIGKIKDRSGNPTVTVTTRRVDASGAPVVGRFKAWLARN